MEKNFLDFHYIGPNHPILIFNHLFVIGCGVFLNSSFYKVMSECPSRIIPKKMTKIITNLVKRLVFNYLTYFKYEGLANLFYDIKPTEFNGNSFLACNKHHYKERKTTRLSLIPFQYIILLFVCNRLAEFKFESSRCF